MCTKCAQSDQRGFGGGRVRIPVHASRTRRASLDFSDRQQRRSVADSPSDGAPDAAGWSAPLTCALRFSGTCWVACLSGTRGWPTRCMRLDGQEVRADGSERPSVEQGVARSADRGRMC
jgi:hypothetical protein